MRHGLITSALNVAWMAASMSGVLLLTTDWMPLGILITALGVIGWFAYLYVRLLKPFVKEERKLRIDRIHEEWKRMVHTVDPTNFTLEHSGLKREDLENKTYVDQTQHWAAWARLFFNPFAERPREFKKSDTWIDKAAIRALKGLALTVKIGWAGVLVVAVAMTVTLETQPTWTVGIWCGWGVWTVLWGAWSRRIWHSKRHVVTTGFLVVIVRRFPFEDPRSIRIPIADIQSATLTQSPVGWFLRFWSLELDVKGSDDPAVSLLTYLRNGRRIDKVIEELRRE